MDMQALSIFLAVAEERSFSRAAAKVHRTQPAVSQAVRRLEVDLGESLFDRTSKNGTLTEAGRVLQNYGARLVRLAEEAESAVRELRDLRRGRVLVGANEAAVHTLLPLIARFRQRYPDVAIDVRRVPARQIAVEVQQGSLDFGALTFHPVEPGLLEVTVGSDELVLLVPPAHALARRRSVTMEEVAAEPVVAHNDPSPARDRVLRLFEQRRIALRIVDRAAEPRRHQAGGGNGRGAGAAAATLRRDRARDRASDGGAGGGRLAPPAADPRLPQGAALARRRRVSRRRPGAGTRAAPLAGDHRAEFPPLHPPMAGFRQGRNPAQPFPRIRAAPRLRAGTSVNLRAAAIG